MPKTILGKRQSCVWEIYLSQKPFSTFFLNLDTDVGGFSTTFQRISSRLLPRFSRFSLNCPRVHDCPNECDKRVKEGYSCTCIWQRIFFCRNIYWLQVGFNPTAKDTNQNKFIYPEHYPAATFRNYKRCWLKPTFSHYIVYNLQTKEKRSNAR